ncbi:MAG: hypothetical protein QOJ11_3982 [Frankiales bacterium]|jgi:uncharacterized protein (TIGR02246 family)|nr:hypothetical protein [Frankiales bacterium]
MTNSTMSSIAEEDGSVRTALDGIFAAWEDNDAEAFVASYTQDATVVLPGIYLRGKDELRATMVAAFAGPLKGSRRTVDLDSVRFLGRDAAVVVGKSAVVHEGAAVPDADGWTFSTWVLGKQDGNWLIAAYHECPASLTVRN